MTINQFGENPYQPGMRQDTFIPDQLIAGPFQLVTGTVQLAAGKVYPRGAVMGQVTASGLYTLSVKTATDGSEVPCAIMVDTVDATDAQKGGGVYLAGEFNAHRLIMDATWTAETLQPLLRNKSLFLHGCVPAPGV
ncbi:TPA: head decoration protein [Klebsiella oxytoca]|uniref:Head decoration protein n=1 Tax=Klebsiella oxytoca TaxID=571 RepID=A0AAN5LAJ7_KLEOX|nr:head decoration protein [Klebsiella oxytoca]